MPSINYSFTKSRLCVGHPWHNAKSQLFLCIKRVNKRGEFINKRIYKNYCMHKIKTLQIQGVFFLFEE